MTDADLCKVLSINNSELNQLRSYINEAEREGWYYGPEHYFRQRHKRLKIVFGMEDDTP